jgi:glyoxylase-like metal-dependent hydrolase (beta-lactamase superfamily II)
MRNELRGGYCSACRCAVSRSLREGTDAIVNSTENLTYDVFVNDPPSQNNGLLPNGDPKLFSPMASTLIYGSENAVLTDPGMTADQARALGDWVAGKGRNLTDIFITHGHGDHWFAAGLLAERFGARVVATAGTVTQMHANVAARPFVWDKVYPGIPPSPVTAVTVPGNRFALEGHDLVIVEVGHTDTDNTSFLHMPDLGLVVAGDVIYNGAHMYLGESMVAGGFGSWREAIDKVEALNPRHIVAGHQNKQLDDDAKRTIAESRQYLDDADELLRTERTAVDFFNSKVDRYPNHLGRTVLWAGASALYGVREHPGEDVAQIIAAGWL